MAVLTGNLGCDEDVNAKTPETAAADPGPSTSAFDQETTRKTPYRSNTAAKSTRWTQPTGAVSPTCHREYDFVNGIPAGYESDNSWDCHSTIGEPERTHNNDITPLVIYRSWHDRPNRE